MPAPAHRPKQKPVITQEMRDRLISAGIGDRYFELTVSQFGDVGIRWLAAFSPENVKESKPILRRGFLAYIDGKGAREFAHTLAAGLLLVYMARVECLHLSSLADALDDKNESRIGELLESDVLVVSEFLNTGSNPLAPRSAFRVESFLLERTETQGKSLILLGDGKIAETKWWTPRITTRIKDAFIQETIATYAHPTAAKIFYKPSETH